MACIDGATTPVCADDERCQQEYPFAAVANDGRVALGGMSAQIVETDSSGVFMRNIGRVGNGPGEYRWVVAGSYDDQGRVRIYDTGTSRLTTFQRNGGVAATSSVPHPPHSMSGALMRNGRLFVSMMPVANDNDSVDLQVMRLDEQRAVFVPIGMKRARSRTIPGTDFMRIPNFFEAPDVWDVGPDGRLSWNRGGDYDIMRFDRSGEMISRLHVTIDREAVTKLDVERERRRVTGKAPVPAGFAEQLDEAARNAADFFPAIDQILAADSGVLWVRRFAPAWADSASWDIWIADRPHATVRLLSNARILAADGSTRALVMTLDELDVPQLAWYRVRVRAPAK